MAPQESGVYYLAGLFCFQSEQANERLQRGFAWRWTKILSIYWLDVI